MPDGKYITAEDYAIYSDIIYYGTAEEKNKVSFMILDVENKGQVTYENYK